MVITHSLITASTHGASLRREKNNELRASRAPAWRAPCPIADARTRGPCASA